MPARGRLLIGATAAYGGAFIIGATLVSFPASSAFLKATHGFSDAQYGAIYLPQLLAAIAGAVLGGLASRMWNLRAIYLISLVLFLASQCLLGLSAILGAREALVAIMTATALFGMGFGLGGGPLNGIVAALFPQAMNTAITALHMCAGAGLTVAPLAFGALAELKQWTLGPILLAALTLLMLALSLKAHLPQGPQSSAVSKDARTPAHDRVFWILALAAVAYALAEGTFSNWAILYLQDDVGLDGPSAASALTAFWAALTVGRLVASALVLRIKPIVFLLVLPPLMIGALVLLRAVHGPASALLSFAFAGLSCSAFFPMLVGFSAATHARHVSWIAAMLTAALMMGVGLGSYAIGSLRATLAIRDLYLYACAYPAIAFVALLAAMRLRGAQRLSSGFR